MTLTIRKTIVLAIVGLILLVASAEWILIRIQESGAVEVAEGIRHEYLTGTAITIVTAMLIMLSSDAGSRKKCSVCGRRVARGSYCSSCGSRQ